jgi:N6-L-threonylcarbamoyladenine synthase
VGLTAAKSLAVALDIPLIAVNHIEAHLYACRLAAGPDVFPAIGFVVSGGHSNLYDCQDAVSIRLLGSTIDDAAGEAFDKVAKMLGLSYPGGPAIQAAAESGNPSKVNFPRPLIHDARLDFSFSGLKTAVLYAAHGQPGSNRAPAKLTDERIADLAASFQEAAVDVLVEKCRQALVRHNRKTLCVGGGVAANRRLRERLSELAGELSVRLILAPLELCTDNAAMAAIAWEHYERGRFAALDLDVTPGLVRRPTASGRED